MLVVLEGEGVLEVEGFSRPCQSTLLWVLPGYLVVLRNLLQAAEAVEEWFAPHSQLQTLCDPFAGPGLAVEQSALPPLPGGTAVSAHSVASAAARGVALSHMPPSDERVTW